ncbi:MAG: RDD family protein, partial [Solirubrobacteraceae bacterium]
MNTTDPLSSVAWSADAFQETKSRRRRIFARSKSVYLRRGEALIIDGLLLVVPILLVDYLFSLAFPNYGFFLAHTQTATGAYTTQTSATLHLGLPGSLLTLTLWLVYYFVCEALTGRTIGKRIVGLRVLSSDGTPAGVNAISARTVLRIIDGLPVLYLVGTLVAILSGRRRRRIGDLAGRTVVVADEGYLPRPRPTIWKLCVYPVGWVCVVMLVIFATGLGKAVSTQEEAVSLLHEYVKARQQHDAALACSLLTPEQQRELVAIQTNDYRQASADLCPQLILGTDPKSSLMNPGLEGLAEGRLQLAYLSG